MSWQAEYEKKYREKLKQEWTPDGQPKGLDISKMGTVRGEQMLEQQKALMLASSTSSPFERSFMNYTDEPGIFGRNRQTENTREICGND